MNFNFQLFAGLHIDGIDDDIMAQLNEEYDIDSSEEEEKEPNANGQVAEENQPESQPGTNDEVLEEEEQEATAEADSDNKQVAENVPNNIPYARFKQENERRKAAERELAELRERLSNQVQQPEERPVATNEPTQKEVMQAVTEEAIKRAKNVLGLTDEDVENLEFSDNIATRMQFQTMVQRESNAILEQARRNAELRIAQENQANETNAAFNKFVEDFQLLADADARWKFISEERFLQLPVFEQGAIKSAFERLQQKQATPGDYFLAVNYFERASKEYDQKNKPVVQPKANTTSAVTKIKQAQALPKAPNVQGVMSTFGMTVDDIVELMNKPGSEGIDKIPPELWQKILKGEPIG